MFIITRTTKRARENPDTGELEAEISHETHVETDVRPQQRLRALGDSRVADLRIFALAIDDEGVPSIGKEILAPG